MLLGGAQDAPALLLWHQLDLQHSTSEVCHDGSMQMAAACLGGQDLYQAI